MEYSAKCGNEFEFLSQSPEGSIYMESEAAAKAAKAAKAVSVARRLNLHGIEYVADFSERWESQSPEGSIYME